MSNKLFFLLPYITCILSFHASGQGEYAGTGRVVAADINPTPLGFVTEVNISNYVPMDGTQYFNENWALADITAQTGTKYKNLYIKINLHNYTLEVKGKHLVKVVSIDEINHLTIETETTKQTFENASKYAYATNSDIPLVGFSQLLLEGDNYSLLKVFKTKIIKSTYNQALDIGKNEDKLVIEELYYLADSENKVYLLDKRKRKFQDNLPLSEEEKKKVKLFIKEEKLKPKKEEDLSEIISFLNSL